MTRVNSRNFHIPDLNYKMALLGGNHKNMEIHPIYGRIGKFEIRTFERSLENSQRPESDISEAVKSAKRDRMADFRRK